MTASQAPGTAARPAGGPPGGRGPGEGGHCVRLPTLATRDLESKKLAADIYDESFLEGFTHGYDASLRGRTKGSCAGCTLKSLAQSYTRQSTHVDFFEQLYGSSGDLTRRDRGSPRQEGPHSARRPRQPTLPKSPRRSATMQLEKQEDEPATPGAASSAKGSRPRLSSSAPSTPKASARRPSASERALEAGPQSTQTLRQREACESLRMLVFGHVGNEDWLVQDRHKIFEQQRGTEAEIDTFVEQWLLLDDDDSGTIDFNEFLDFFAKKKADKLLGMRCVRYLVGRREDNQVCREDLIRLLWLRATDADVAAMEALFDLKKLQRAAVEPLPLLSKRRRRELLENFKDLDSQGKGLVPYTELVMAGLADEDMMKELQAKYDKDGNGTLDFEEFLEMLCPYGFRAHSKVKVAITKDGQAMRFATCKCGENMFTGWFMETDFLELQKTYALEN